MQEEVETLAQQLREARARITQLESEAGLLRTLLETIPDFVYFKDADRRFVRASRMFEQLLGKQHDEIIGRRDEDLFPPDISPDTVADDRRVIEQGEAIINKIEGGKMPDGTQTWVSTTKVPWRDADGRILGLCGISRNVTAAKLAQDESRRNTERLEIIARTVPYPLGVTRLSDGRAVFANDALCVFLGLRHDELLGTLIPDYYANPEDRATVMKALAETGRVEDAHVRMRRGDGEVRLMSASAVPLSYDGEACLMGVAVDITEFKQTEQALRELSEQQETLLREVNHRVGNNLTALLALLQRETARLREHGETAATEVFLKLKARLLGLARVHAMLSSSQWRPIALTGLAREVVEATCRAFEPFPSVVVAGEDVLISSAQAQQLTLVLSELTLNTLKHAAHDDAHIRVDLRVDGEALELTYADDGDGFPPHVLEAGAESGQGLTLVDGIVGHSLRGQVRRENDGGAVTRIRFAREVGA